MTYTELLEQCRRAVCAQGDIGNLQEAVQALNYHTPFNRQIACEKIAFLLAEYIDAPAQEAARAVKH